MDDIERELTNEPVEETHNLEVPPTMMNSPSEKDQQPVSRFVGSGLPNVLVEVRYNKQVNQVERLHYKYLSKKRSFLVR